MDSAPWRARPSGATLRAAMYPGCTSPRIADKPAVIMGGVGLGQTYAELDAAANRLSRVLRDAGLRARRPRRALHGEPPALPRGAVGLPLRRPDLHRRLVAADGRRARVHRQRLRGAGRHHLGVSPRPGRGIIDATPERASYDCCSTAHRRATTLRGRRRRASTTHRCPTASPAPTCSTRRAPPASRRA